MGRRFALALFLAAAAAAQGRARALPPPQDDRFVTVRTGAHARERREQLVRYLWGMRACRAGASLTSTGATSAALCRASRRYGGLTSW